jgi:hypothetical protein
LKFFSSRMELFGERCFNILKIDVGDVVVLRINKRVVAVVVVVVIVAGGAVAVHCL